MADENSSNLEEWLTAFISIDLEFSHLKREQQTYDRWQAASETDITNMYLIYN